MVKAIATTVSCPYILQFWRGWGGSHCKTTNPKIRMRPSFSKKIIIIVIHIHNSLLESISMHSLLLWYLSLLLLSLSGFCIYTDIYIYIYLRIKIKLIMSLFVECWDLRKAHQKKLIPPFFLVIFVSFVWIN